MFIEIHTGGQLRKRIQVPDEQLPNVSWLPWHMNVDNRKEFIEDILRLFFDNVAPMFDHDPTVQYYIIFESKMHLHEQEHSTETPPIGGTKETEELEKTGPEEGKPGTDQI